MTLKQLLKALFRHTFEIAATRPQSDMAGRLYLEIFPEFFWNGDCGPLRSYYELNSKKSVGILGHLGGRTPHVHTNSFDGRVEVDCLGILQEHSGSRNEDAHICMLVLGRRALLPQLIARRALPAKLRYT